MRLTHGGMTARLDQVTTGSERDAGTDASGRARRSRPSGDGNGDGGGNGNGHGHGGPSDDLDVPEFIPRG